jgi:sialate O-acetylesterase
MRHSFVLFLTCFLAFTSLKGAVQPNGIFSDHMVLQQKLLIMVWGTATEGEKVSVELKGPDGDLTDATASAIAMGGKWKVKLPPLPAGGPYTLTITGENKVQINDVLIGEVWLCSGQSNMERQLGPRPPQPDIVNWQRKVADTNHPEIRQYYVYQTKSNEPADSVHGVWAVCSPQTAANFTAVGYFFARDLQKTLNIPIGIIHSSWGGTPIKGWTSRDAMQADPDLKKISDGDEEIIKKHEADLADYKAKQADLLDQYNKDVAQASQDGKPAPKKPEPPGDLFGWGCATSVLYNGMIAPLQPYTIRGVVWYQGESDSGHGKTYETQLPAMIADWRKAWGEGDFPFLIVQIAPCSGWDPAIREAELLTWKKTPATALVVTTDIGSIDAHPPHKQLVGERLNLAARAIVYGEKVEYSGQVYESADYNGNQAVLHFSHIGGGLVAKDGDLKGFEISGDGKNFIPAKAEIQGDIVVVTADQVSSPQSVRFGWKPIPDDNLFNKEGLPASPFCTNPE